MFTTHPNHYCVDWVQCSTLVRVSSRVISCWGKGYKNRNTCVIYIQLEAKKYNNSQEEVDAGKKLPLKVRQEIKDMPCWGNESGFDTVLGTHAQQHLTISNFWG